MDEQAKEAKASASASAETSLATLEAIKRQADLMDRQVAEMQQSRKQTIDAMMRQAHQMEVMASATSQSAATAQMQVRDAKNQERARLSLTILSEETPITKINWHSKLQIVNQGISHAYHAIIFLRFEFLDSPVPPPMVKTDYEKSLPIIRAGKRRTIRIRPLGFPVWELMDLEDVAKGRKFLHLYGRVEYTDVFEDRRQTPFRFLWNAQVGNTWGDSPNWMEALRSDDPKQT